MKQIIFLSSDNHNATTGAAKFIRLFFCENGLFENNGYKLIRFTNSYIYSNELAYKKSIVFKFKQNVKKMLAKTSWGQNIAFFCYQLNVLGRRPVDSAVAYIDKDNLVILNDFRVAWNFYKKYGKTRKTIFLMHNDGELFSMMQDQTNTKRMRDFFHECECLIFKNADKIVFVSEVARKKFLTKYQMHAGKTHTIHIGLSEECVIKRQVNKPIKFISVGTICKRKNQILAIKAIEKLKDENVILNLIGEGPELDECKKYVKEHNLQENVNFLGTSLDVARNLQESDVFIMTSKIEGLPVAAQEAMAKSLPLILTDVGGCRELIDNNGILVTVDLNEVVSAMKFICDNKDLIIPYGEKSYDIYKSKFSVEIMQAKYVNLFNDIYN